jgi:hypothetical protein
MALYTHYDAHYNRVSHWLDSNIRVHCHCNRTQFASIPERRAKGNEYLLNLDLLSEIDSLCDGNEQRKLQFCALALVFLNGDHSI